MKHIILVVRGRTDWEAQNRLAGTIDLPLNAAGQEQVRQGAETLATLMPSAVFSGPEEASRQTAGILSKRFGLRPRKLKDLHEMGLGLWEGLTDDQLRERFSKAYRQWHDDPSTICPPEGETMTDAAARLNKVLAKALKRGGEGDIVLVSGPHASAILRLRITNRPLTEFWALVEEGQRTSILDWPDSQSAHDAAPA